MSLNSCTLGVVQIILSLSVISCYQIEIANYESLRNQHILTENLRFNHYGNPEEEITKDLKGELLNEDFGPKLYFEMFLYPYRVYSYFDQSNKKQYLFKKIALQEFSLDENQKNEQKSFEPITYAEFDVRECLFEKSSVDSDEDKETKNNQIGCLKQSHLYSLIPDLINLVQEEHERIQVEKVNEQYFLIKNHADPNSKKPLNYFLDIDLLKINIHSFIYEARFTLMKFLFEEKHNEHKNLSNTVQNEHVNIDKDDNENQPKSSSSEKDESFFIIKMKDFFNSEYEVWDLLTQRNVAILRNLFNFEASFDIGKYEKYDYASTQNVFYLTQINETKCALYPQSKKSVVPDDTSIDLNPEFLPSEYRCTHMKFYKIPFVQFEVQDATEYFSKEDNIDEVKKVSLGTIIRDKNSKTLGLHNIKVNLMTKSMNIEISRTKSWKEYGYSHRHESYEVNSEASNVFYLENSKVEIEATELVIYKSDEKNLGIYNKECELTFEPYLITSQKVNNQLFVVCLEGSKCKIIDRQCHIVQEILLENALGVEWNYKINYFQDKILSYISVFKRSDNLYKIIDAPIDETFVQLPSLKSSEFFMHTNFIQIQPGIYKGNLTFVDSTIKFKKIFEVVEIFSSFQPFNLPIKLYPPQLFEDKTYKSFYSFKERYLDDVLKFEIEEKFAKYYVPNFKNFNENETVKIINMKNYTDFENFFSDCTYDEEKRTVTFKEEWNGCKIIMKTDALMLADSFELKKFEDQNLNIDTGEHDKKIEDQKKVLNEEHEKETFLEILTKEKLDPSKNKMVVCSSHKSSSAYAKCRVSEYEVTESFHEGKRKAKFFFEGSRYFQIYFFNQKFATEQGSKSFLEVLENLASQSIIEEDKFHKKENTAEKSQLKEFKIVYSQTAVESKKHYDINLIDYEKQELENLSKILLITLCILFPIFTICCCVVCFKSYFENILVYYGVMRVQPSFSYPLGKLALKIRLREFQKDGYLTIHRNKREHKKEDELSSNLEIKYSAECCFCLEELKLNEEVIELYCRHEFHSICFIEWVRNEPNTKCPLCKRIFTKSALNQFKSISMIASSSSRTRDEIDGQNEHLNEQEDYLSNQLEMIEFES